MATKRPYVHFIGGSASDVTGSAHMVHWQDQKILLDCGMIQSVSPDIYSTYKENKDLVKRIKPNTVNVVLLSHCHNDHSGLIPALYANGYKGLVYVPTGSKRFLEIMWADSAKIIQSDTAKIQKKFNNKFKPLYTQDDVETALAHIVEMDFNYPIMIGHGIGFKFLHAGHIINSATIYLTLTDIVTKRIWYTGDIGGDIPNDYVDFREHPSFCDLAICESTYCEKGRVGGMKDRVKDLEKMTSIINDYRTTIIPCFALARGQQILTELYRLWELGAIPHDIQIVYDSPLGTKLSNVYCDEPMWQKVWAWKNIIKVDTFKESQALQKSNSKMVVISSSGMLTGGRVLSWLKAKLPEPDTHLMFVGYVPTDEDTVASDIKTGKAFIEIDGETVEDNCNYTELRSFSSHANYYELLDFYSLLKTNKLCLVHGDMTNKIAFSDVLQEKFVEQGLSTRVSAVQIGDKIYF